MLSLRNVVLQQWVPKFVGDQANFLLEKVTQAWDSLYNMPTGLAHCNTFLCLFGSSLNHTFVCVAAVKACYGQHVTMVHGAGFTRTFHVQLVIWRSNEILRCEIQHSDWRSQAFRADFQDAIHMQ